MVKRETCRLGKIEMSYPNPGYILETSGMTCYLRLEDSGQDEIAASDLRVISESRHEQRNTNKTLELMNGGSPSTVDAVIRKPDFQLTMSL